MSNRTHEAGAFPLIMDPMQAVRLGQALNNSRRQLEQTVGLGQAVAALFTDIRSVIGGIGLAINRAIRMRDLCALSDRQLSDIGIERGQIPMLFIEGRLVSAMHPTTDQER